jgi:hypothetical protein
MSPSPDFESGASTSSAIPAFLKKGKYSKPEWGVNVKFLWRVLSRRQRRTVRRFLTGSRGQAAGRRVNGGVSIVSNRWMHNTDRWGLGIDSIRWIRRHCIRKVDSWALFQIGRSMALLRASGFPALFNQLMAL